MTSIKSEKPGAQAPFDEDLHEVLYEVIALGNAVKVSALDPASNTEVCVVGPVTASPYTLKMNALRKLKAKLRCMADLHK